jgi:hypothetical protein
MNNVSIIDVPQRSPEWHAARLGRLTASCVGDAFAQTKSGWGAGRRNLRIRLVLERLTKRSQESGYVSPAMERGAQLEADARSAYEVETGRLVETVGFLSHNEILTGASPDGLVDADGVLELKCPQAAAHLDYLRGGLPNDYRLQIIHTIWLSGRAWGDFASFNPDFPEPLRLKVTRVVPTPVELTAHEFAVRLFLSECQKEYDEVAALMTVAA